MTYIPRPGLVRSAATAIFVTALLWTTVLGNQQAPAVDAVAAAAHYAEVEVAKAVNKEHLRCLATNIYHEAASEPFMGQVAVARVVVNRVRHGFANNPCGVVYQKTTIVDPDNPEEERTICQFSWVCSGKGQPPRNGAYIRAEEIARSVLAENRWSEDVPSNILFFHNGSVNPGWAYRQAMVIGNHIFYAKK